ncbi:MAG: biotin carboxylase N-terminal domain-containing protein [Pseudomonadota bacterium]
MNIRPFSCVLVANRGEIALRVIEAAQGLGLTAVAVYSEADVDMPFVRAADLSVCIGPAPAADSYLDIDAILSAAVRTGAEAIHPGYGFLSENAAFARAVIEAGLVWIGPPPNAIEAMGDKARAKQLMIEAKVPVLPGWQGDDQSAENLQEQAEAIGFPLLIKAVAGGGGRGMRIVESADAFDEALASARREAKSAFGDEAVLLEKFIERGRHVEIQIFADSQGRTIHLGERDCSAQRRRQKVIEEAPSPAVKEALRDAMGRDAVRAAEAVNYVGAGTVEFLLDDSGGYYFLEMNTRLQVEHPVTEEVTGEPLIAMQLDIAAGHPLALAQDQIDLRGHAIEARLYAEDPENGFAPQSGPVVHFDPSAQSYRDRVDHGVESGDAIGADYDPMVAKFIAWDETRAGAIEKLRASLIAHPLLGVKTNRDFLLRLLADPAFATGEMRTSDLDRWAEAESGPFAAAPICERALSLAALLLSCTPDAVVRSASVSRFTLELEVDGQAVSLPIAQTGPDAIEVEYEGRTISAEFLAAEDASVTWRHEGVARTDFAAQIADRALHLAIDDRMSLVAERSPWSDAAADDPSLIRAPVTGAVVKLNVAIGASVKAGEVLAVMEAMKMEMRLPAVSDGVVKAVHVSEGAQAPGGFVLIELDLQSQD